MKKAVNSKKLLILLLIIIMGMGGHQIVEATNDDKQQIETYPKPYVYDHDEVDSLLELWQENIRRYNLKSYDLSSLKLNESFYMDNFVFNSQTKWPEKLPKSFDLNKLIKYGRNSGLNIRKLHKKGITGKGVNVGIVDGRLLVDHTEFKDNIRVYEETFNMHGTTHFHGTPITSILAGDSNGVAPDVGIYYMAYLDNYIDRESGYIELADAIEKLIEINKTLPKDEKMKVISISSGWFPESKNAKEIYKAIEKAKKENIFVISARLFETHNLNFTGLRRDPWDDPDKVSSYNYIHFSKQFDKSDKEILLVPMDGRWMASATGQKNYVYYSKGAWSTAIPYISGLYALAIQVNPDITPDEFWDTALSTGNSVKNENSYSSNYKGRTAKIVNPVKLIETISSKAGN
jgi:hypothetical protein